MKKNPVLSLDQRINLEQASSNNQVLWELLKLQLSSTNFKDPSNLEVKTFFTNLEGIDIWANMEVKFEETKFYNSRHNMVRFILAYLSSNTRCAEAEYESTEGWIEACKRNLPEFKNQPTQDGGVTEQKECEN